MLMTFVLASLVTSLLALRAGPLRPPRVAAAPRRCGVPCLTGVEHELDRFFFDRAEVFVKSGAGGNGAVATQGTGSRPAGADGGAGGSVYIECCAVTNTLGHLQGVAHVIADRGEDATGRKDGSRGAGTTVRVPPHTLVVDRSTNVTLRQLVEPGERMLVAAGGEGGEGNGALWRRTRDISKKTGPPGGTERRWLVLSMTLVADVGLIGYPNAGKSTLLRAVTRATPKVADYPFTTLVPNLGVCEASSFGLHRSMVWLDIPGLIDGAHAGRGIGRAFLRHTERCRLLLHLINGESETPAEDLASINNELRLYSTALGRTTQVVVLTKTDLPHVAARADETLAALQAATPHKRLLCISARSGDTLPELVRRTRALLDALDDRAAAAATTTTTRTVVGAGPGRGGVVDEGEISINAQG